MGLQRIYDCNGNRWERVRLIFCEGWTPAVEIRCVFCGMISHGQTTRPPVPSGVSMVVLKNIFNVIMSDSDVILLWGTAFCGWLFVSIVCTVNALWGNSLIFFGEHCLWSSSVLVWHPKGFFDLSTPHEDCTAPNFIDRNYQQPVVVMIHPRQIWLHYEPNYEPTDSQLLLAIVPKHGQPFSRHYYPLIMNHYEPSTAWRRHLAVNCITCGAISSEHPTVFDVHRWEVVMPLLQVHLLENQPQMETVSWTSRIFFKVVEMTASRSLWIFCKSKT